MSKRTWSPSEAVFPQKDPGRQGLPESQGPETEPWDLNVNPVLSILIN